MRLATLAAQTFKGTSKAYSIHIGVNRVAASHYGSSVAELFSCITDAQAMRAITPDFEVLSDSASYPEIFANGASKIGVVENAIKQAAKKAIAGDFVLLTFSGHGFSVDLEEHGRHAAWCLSDFPMFDTHLFALLSEFASGVRVLVVSDSCSSGGVPHPPPIVRIDFAVANVMFADSGTQALGAGHEKRLSESVVATLSGNHLGTYKAAIADHKRKTLSASIVHMVACEEGQVTYAGPTFDSYSVFTAIVLAVWNDGKGASDFVAFERELCDKAPAQSTPDIEVLPPEDSEFLVLGPFRTN